MPLYILITNTNHLYKDLSVWEGWCMCPRVVAMDLGHAHTMGCCTTSPGSGELMCYIWGHKSFLVWGLLGIKAKPCKLGHKANNILLGRTETLQNSIRGKTHPLDLDAGRLYALWVCGLESKVNNILYIGLIGT